MLGGVDALCEVQKLTNRHEFVHHPECDCVEWISRHEDSHFVAL